MKYKLKFHDMLSIESYDYKTAREKLLLFRKTFGKNISIRKED